MKTSHVANNELKRKFRSFLPRKALLTDITYLFYKNGVCYISLDLDEKKDLHPVSGYAKGERWNDKNGKNINVYGK